MSIFQRGSIDAVHNTKKYDTNEHAPVTPEIMQKIKRHYRKDYEMKRFSLNLTYKSFLRLIFM